jgi:hypothetical protein
VSSRGALMRWIIPSTITVAILGVFATPALAAGPTVTDSKYGFSFSLPSGWEHIPLTGGDVSGLLDIITKNDPSMKCALSSDVKQEAHNGIKVFALGPISKNFASNVNVIVEGVSGLPSGSTYFDERGGEVKLELSGAGMNQVETSTVDLPFGKEMDSTYTLKKSWTRSAPAVCRSI